MEQRYLERIEAVKRHLAGEKPVTIYKSLGKKRTWFYYWISRYNSNDPNWYKDKPNINKIIKNKIEQKLEDTICAVRNNLVNTKYAQIGAFTIRLGLENLKIKKIPTDRTIERVLKRNKLTNIKKQEKYKKKNKVYPKIEITKPNQVHSLDLVGPRYLGKGNKFFSDHVIDLFSNMVVLKQYKGKRDIYILDVLVRAWQKLGIPLILQMDNELSFKGSNKYPRSLGKILRLCLYLNIEPLFVPESEPWRQGVIERFNNTFDKSFFRNQVFENFEHMCKESDIFEDFHNKNHRYSKNKGKVPIEVHNSIKIKTLPDNFDIHTKHIPFKNGKISFIRFTNDIGKVRFFTETFEVSKELCHEYVKGTIDTKENVLAFYYDNELVKELKYKVKKKYNRKV